MATTVNPAVPAASTGAPPAPTGSGLPAGNPPAPPAGNSSDGGPLPSSSEGNIKQLREQYEATKGKLEPWEKLGKYDEVSKVWQTISTLKTEVTALGNELGYDPKEIEAEFAVDPYAVLAFLRSRQAQTEGNLDPKKYLDQELNKRLKPILSREEERQNQEASFRFEKAGTEALDKMFPPDKDGKSTITEDERGAIQEVATEMFKYDPEAMKGLREGKTSFVTKHFDAAKQFLDKYFLARSKREQMLPSPPPPPGEGNKKRPSLKDMIDGSYEFRVKT